MARNEAKTRRELVEPKLRQAGWGEHDWQIEDKYRITAGRISFDGKVGRRSSPVSADYLLRYRRSRALAVVEVKAEGKHHCEGERQAKDYAARLGLWFAYATEIRALLSSCSRHIDNLLNELAACVVCMYKCVVSQTQQSETHCYSLH